MFEQLVLRLIHCILSFGVFLKQCTSYFIHFGLVFKQKSSVDFIKADARHINKLPVHIGIVVLEEKLSYTDIANIIIWSLALGISCISVYDVNGEFKRNHAVLKEVVAKKQKEILHEESTKYSICLHTNNQTDLYLENGYSNNCKIDLQLVGPEDGRRELVKLAQNLSREVATHQRKLEDITIQHVDNILQGTNKFPDPDLIIRFGTVDSLLGFLPWQIRLTEILTHQTHDGLTYKSFISLLHSYGGTEQRFGR